MSGDEIVSDGNRHVIVVDIGHGNHVTWTHYGKRSAAQAALTAYRKRRPVIHSKASLATCKCCLTEKPSDEFRLGRTGNPTRTCLACRNAQKSASKRLAKARSIANARG